MIPSAEEIIPIAFFQKDVDPLRYAFIQKFNSIMADYQAQIKNFEFIQDPEKVAAQFLPELANLLATELFVEDTDAAKRKKILTSVKGLRNKDLWTQDIKIKIDLLTGNSAVLYGGQTTDNDWILEGDAHDLLNDWGCFGGDGTEPFGFELLGTGGEYQVAGNIYIDLGASGISSDIIDSIRANITSKYAYFNIHLGYTTGDVFTEYP